MYLEFFSLQKPPFSITPDPACVYLSDQHQESLAHLVYGVTRGGGAGFVQLTGEVGTGKTTISRLFLQQLPADTRAALILNPAVTPLELMESLFTELKISRRGVSGRLNRMVERLNEDLLAAWSEGQNTVIIIDEAQNIPRDTLEHLRLLTNLETDQQKLLQIILIGQPELNSLMQRRDLRQLAQRVSSRFHLRPLSAEETEHYIRHRLTVSGGRNDLFESGCYRRIHRHTGGVPRLINVLCDRALLAAYAGDSDRVRPAHIRRAIAEMSPAAGPAANPAGRLAWLWPAVAAALLLALALLWGSKRADSDGRPVEQSTALSAQPLAESPPAWPSREQAWAMYVELLGGALERTWLENGCPPPQETGLACVRRFGNLTQILHMDAPVLLQLLNGRLLLLTGVRQDSIIFAGAQGEPLERSSEWLAGQWLGSYYVLWSMPPEIMHAPDQQTTLTWAAKLADIIAEPEQVAAVGLHNWIVAFQQDNGLVADGIVGTETQLMLSLRAYQRPRLSKQ